MAPVATVLPPAPTSTHPATVECAGPAKFDGVPWVVRRDYSCTRAAYVRPHSPPLLPFQLTSLEKEPPSY
jgi:hypothetical protein